MSFDVSERLDAILDPSNWSIDRATADLVEARMDICINRVVIDRAVAATLGLSPSLSDDPNETIWVFGAGPFLRAKTFGHGRTVEEAHAAYRAKLLYESQPISPKRPRSTKSSPASHSNES